jgi:formate dehydrogenase major subunit
VPGLGTTYGRGGATTFAMDLKHSDSILIMGSNMAECHPVAFRWVIQAKTRPHDPCTVIHADPRFTRTSAMANIYAPVRAGSDIVFLGALIKYVLDKHAEMFRRLGEGRDRNTWSDRERFFHDYLTRYTNAPTLIAEDFKDTEELEGVFSGLDRKERKYNQKKWRYDGQPEEDRKPGGDKTESFSARVGKLVGKPPNQDLTLTADNCVFQIVRAHYARYTPEMVEQVCGTPRDVFEQVARTLYANAGPDRTGAICYAVGWTQHTTGVQMIRAAAILQLLLGNAGRPGGGILALRGHATIQGSTDIPTLYNLLPGYLNAPSALRPHDTLAHYIDVETSATSYWSNLPAFFISLLRAWFGNDAKPEKEYAYDYLPKMIGDHSHMPMFVEMSKGTIEGFFAMGQNPAVGGQNASFQRQALAKLKWLVVRDLYETETATFWKDSPEVKNGKLKPEDIPTEVFFLPAAAVAENDGSFTNTQRLLQFHEKAVDPPGDARSDLWFTYHLGKRLKALYEDKLTRLRKQDPKQAKVAEKHDRAIRALTWDYFNPDEVKDWKIKDEPSARLVLKEVIGYRMGTPGAALLSLKDSEPLDSFGDLKDDGTTASGAWIYTGVYAGGKNHAADRDGRDDWVAPGWGFSWPANRRILYNRASADPEGHPWAKEARLAQQFGPRGKDGRPLHRGYVYWDAAQKRWVGVDVPDFAPTKAPNTPANPKGVGLAFHDGASPFIMKADGKGWLFVPNGLVDGPLPTHYEPAESPVGNVVYPKQRSNPVLLYWKVKGNELAPESAEYPHVLSTYRLTEHHLSGVMSRWLPWLAELMPELFCELSPEHAAEIGVGNTEWVSISTPRGTIRAKALVTRRIRPFHLGGGKVVHHVGLPWHWGYKGISKGDVVNDLSALVGDPNVSIHEAKVFVCDVTRG